MANCGLDSFEAPTSIYTVVVDQHLRELREGRLLGLRSDQTSLTGLADSTLQQLDRVRAIRRPRRLAASCPGLNTGSTRSPRSFARRFAYRCRRADRPNPIRGSASSRTTTLRDSAVTPSVEDFGFQVSARIREYGSVHIKQIRGVAGIANNLRWKAQGLAGMGHNTPAKASAASSELKYSRTCCTRPLRKSKT